MKIWKTTVSRVIFSVLTLTLFSLSAHSYNSCEKITQCDYCVSDSQFQQAALDGTPSIPPGESLLNCRVLVTNLVAYEARSYDVNKGEEPGFTYAWATFTPMSSAEQVAFNNLFSKLSLWEATPQSITVPAEVVSSAYALPGSTFSQSQVANYIIGNHPLWSGLYSTLGGVFSLVDAGSGSAFSKLLVLKITFSDGSIARYKLEVLGLGSSEWQVVEGSLKDGDGNTIFFDASDYNGQSGPITGAGVGFLINRLGAGGWSVNGDNSDKGGGCSWSCGGNTCTITCSKEGD